MTADKWAIGIDLGGTKIKAARVDESGTIQDQIKESTDVSGVKAVQKQIEGLAHKLIGKSSGKAVSLGIGVAGQIDKETGAVAYAPNLKWHDVPLDANLEKRLDLPVFVLNDVRAAAWGEWLHGAGKECDHMICMFVGTGIGGGIVSEGKMVKGASNSAGEIGHMTVQLDGPRCHCGNRGCLEALAGSWAIERNAKEAINTSGDTNSAILKLAGGDKEQITAKMVIKAYEEEDKLARQLIDRVINALAGGLTGITNTLNPERIILGGGVIEHLPNSIPLIEKKVKKRALKAATPSLKIVPTRLHDNSGVIGAAAFALQKNDNLI